MNYRMLKALFIFISELRLLVDKQLPCFSRVVLRYVEVGYRYPVGTNLVDFDNRVRNLLCQFSLLLNCSAFELIYSDNRHVCFTSKYLIRIF